MGRHSWQARLAWRVGAVALTIALGVAGSRAAGAAPSVGVTLTLSCSGTPQAVLTVTNQGSAPVTVSTVAVAGAPDDAFAPVVAGLVLAPGGSETGTRTGPIGSLQVVLTVVGDDGEATIARSAACAPAPTTTAVPIDPTVTAAPTTVDVAPSPTTPPTVVPAPPDTTVVAPGPPLPTSPGGPAPGSSVPASTPPTSPRTTRAGSGSTVPAAASTSTTAPGDTGGSPGDATRKFDFRFQRAGTMTVGVAARVAVLVTPTGVVPDRPLATFDATAPTVVEQRRVGCDVEARLSVRPGDFEVVDGGAMQAEICEGDPTREFVWTVVPLRAGPLPVTVVLVYGKDVVRTEKVVAQIEVTGVPTSTSGASTPTVTTGSAASTVAAGGSGTAWWTAAVVLLAAGAAGAVAVVRRRRRGPAVATVTAAAPGGPDGRPVVFLSYSRHDRDAVAEIHAELEAHGYDVWRDVDDIAAGDAWRHAIVEGLRRSVAVLFVVSSNSAGSMQVAREIALADEERKPIIPLVLPGAAELPGSLRYTLAGTQVVDLRVLSREEGVARVSAALAAIVARTALARPPAPLPAPLPPVAGAVLQHGRPDGATPAGANPAGAQPDGAPEVRPLA